MFDRLFARMFLSTFNYDLPPKFHNVKRRKREDGFIVSMDVFLTKDRHLWLHMKRENYSKIKIKVIKPCQKVKKQEITERQLVEETQKWKPFQAFEKKKYHLLMRQK